MDRNILFAFLLSTLVLLGYYQLFPPEAPVPKEAKQSTEAKPAVLEQAATAEKPAVDAAAPAQQATTQVPQASGVAEDIKVSTPLYDAVLNTKDGVLKSFQLNQFAYAGPDPKPSENWVYHLFSKKEKPHYDPARKVEMIGHNQPVWFVGSDLKDQSVTYFNSDKKEVTLKDQPETLSFVGTLPNGLVLTKTATFRPDSYEVDLSVKLENPGDHTIKVAPTLNFGAGNEPVEPDQFNRPQEGAVYEDGSFDTYSDDDMETPIKLTKLTWVGVMDTYFISMFKPKGEDNFSTLFEGIEIETHDTKMLVPVMKYQEPAFELRSGQNYQKTFQLYIGPKVQSKLEAYHPKATAALDLGWFDFFAYPMLAILRWLHGVVHNWGVAIILLTFVVRAILFPLAFKGMMSMRRMAKLNPRMKYLKDKYKKDKERLNREVMALYSKNKVSPIGGCLPLMAQVPVFIALYSALMPAIELRHQPFALWLTNLSASDYTLVLPILMGVTMYIQQHITPQPSMDPTQAKVMKWMPVMMMFFFLNMPSGLVLYWVISNILTIFQQMLFNKVKEAEIQH